MQKRTGEELNLLLDWNPDRSARRWLRDGIGSLLVHAAIAAFLILLSRLPSSPPAPEEDIAAELQHATRLAAPPLKLTQKEPNPGKAADQVNLDELLAKSRLRAPVPPRQFQPPSLPAPPPAPKPAAPAIPAPPKIEAAIRGPQLPPPGVDTTAPPPRIQAEEPKLAMQNVGTPNGTSSHRIDFGNMPIHPLSVEEAAHAAVHDSGAGMEVQDPEQYAPNRPDAFGRMPSPYKNLVTPQLLSDPHGVNFRPYLIQVLLAVKKNWLVVIPESARMGRRGYVTLQFIIARNGSVPKLVIATPSGTEAFDRAAVAGVSASNPFPPLPSEFPGNEIRVQLGFTYNEPRR
ncbi:MAG: energy transducer TonB [Bryobacteraceae bacterium]|jgi:TonB family protein